MGHFVRLFQLQPPACLFVQRAPTIPHQLHQVKNGVPAAGTGVKGCLLYTSVLNKCFDRDGKHQNQNNSLHMYTST